MKKILFLLISLAFLVACGPSKKEQAMIEFNEGVRLLYKKNNKAIEHFNKALELNPELVEAIVYRAKVYINNADYNKAVKEVTRAIEKDPNHGDAYKTRALAKFYLDDRDGSCADYLKADELGVPNLENKIRHCK